MGAKLLVIVEDTFALAHRGVVVAPDADLPDGPRRTISVELRRPDGTVLHAEAHVEVPFFNPPSLQPRQVLRFANLTKTDIPVGTEIWMTA